MQRRPLPSTHAAAPGHRARHASVHASTDRRADVDVAVVGAGIAGLTAARELRAAGIGTVVLEARDRVGGRAWSVERPSGLELDMGAAWLHSAETNPLVAMARAGGHALHPGDLGRTNTSEEVLRAIVDGALAADDPPSLGSS